MSVQSPAWHAFAAQPLHPRGPGTFLAAPALAKDVAVRAKEKTQRRVDIDLIPHTLTGSAWGDRLAA